MKGPSIQWVVKASSLCNLRCRYCYEWDELADPRRMSIEHWQQLARQVAKYHRYVAEHEGKAYDIHVVLHGGEPLLLPNEYISSLLAVLRQELSPTATGGGVASIHLQTNLYQLRPDTLRTLQANDVSVGVSYDGKSGVRLSAAGVESSAKVRFNMKRLSDLDIRFGLITVLGRHTLSHLPEIYDLVANQNINWRILPLFAGPSSRIDVDTFDLEESKIAKALFDLFRRWLDDGCRVNIEPLRSSLEIAIRELLELSVSPYDRAGGERVVIVRRDSHIFSTNEYDTPSFSYGNIFDDDILELMTGARRRQSLDRASALTRRLCTGCTFSGACDTFPAQASPYNYDSRKRCHHTYQLLDFIKGELIRSGFGADELGSVLRTMTVAS